MLVIFSFCSVWKPTTVALPVSFASLLVDSVLSKLDDEPRTYCWPTTEDFLSC